MLINGEKVTSNEKKGPFTPSNDLRTGPNADLTLLYLSPYLNAYSEMNAIVDGGLHRY